MIITIMTVLIICLVTLIPVILFILRDGFVNLKTTNWNIKNSKKLTNWENVLKNSQKLIVKPLFNGKSKEEPGARPWLNEDTIPEDYDRFAPSNCPTMNFAISHKKYGDILIDAGINSSFNKSNKTGDLSILMKMYQKNSKYHYDLGENDNIKYNLKDKKIDPKYVFLTHLHPDHVAGLTEIPSNAVTVFGKKENSFFYKLMVGKYLKRMDNIQTLDFKNAQELYPFSKVIDIFGDSSILAISSAGHSEDHISYFINDMENPSLIVGDLTISTDYFKRGIEISSDSPKRDEELLENSLKELGEFMKLYPKVKIYYSHDYDEDIKTQ